MRVEINVHKELFFKELSESLLWRPFLNQVLIREQQLWFSMYDEMNRISSEIEVFINKIFPDRDIEIILGVLISELHVLFILQ